MRAAMHKPWSLVVLSLALAGAAAAATVGCSSSPSSNADSGAPKPCNENGGACPDGQTCWPQSATTFACLNEGPGKVGDSCQNTPGTPTCGHGLACLQTTSTCGTCLPYCDPTNPAEACSRGQCTTAVLGGASGPQFEVCVGAAPACGGADAGTDSGSSSGGTDAGSSSGGNDAGSSSGGGDAAAGDAAAD
jgi:hypothetical protein